MTCDDTTDVCPGTELTCTCSVNSTSGNIALIWTLPGSVNIALDDKVSSNSTTTNGMFFAVVTNNTGVVLKSMLIYTANESLVNGTIECKEPAMGQPNASVTINDTFAG